MSDIPPWVDDRLQNFSSKIHDLFVRHKATPNLLPYQCMTIQNLKTNPKLLFLDTDKGLGPCAVTYDQYVKDALVHLTDTSTFTQLSKEEAWTSARDINKQIQNWLKKYRKAITKDEVNYIKNHIHQNCNSPFGQFYVSYKVHKPPINGNYPTRPVCSDVSSLPHGLGKWVDLQLQPIAHSQPSYFKDSFTLKTLLSNLHLPQIHVHKHPYRSRPYPHHKPPPTGSRQTIPPL
jgi:hypothetical protein